MSDQLLRLRQGASSTNEYTLPFRTLVATTGWNEVAFLSAYRHGLDNRICAQMVIFDYFGLESFMQKANRISQCLSAYHSTEATHQSVSPATGSPVPEPMQVDSTRLSHDEHARRLDSAYSNFHAFHATNATIHSNPFCYSLRPYQLGLLWQLHLERPSDSPASALPPSCPGAETIKGKPLGCGYGKYEAPPFKLKIGKLA